MFVPFEAGDTVTPPLKMVGQAASVTRSSHRENKSDRHAVANRRRWRRPGPARFKLLAPTRECLKGKVLAPAKTWFVPLISFAWD
jgi:hypothetical protein